ncbi:hypothetical protein KC799_26325 [candidate division KSB1 bacterium]|nr:hypothetical protein [candidate division KSB1 bacterium]
MLGLKKTIIAIHGLGNKPALPDLEDWWIKAIHEGLERIGKPRHSIPFKLVYWADILHPVPLDTRISNKKDPLFEPEPYMRVLPDTPRIKPSFRAKLYRYIAEQLDNVFLNEDMSLNYTHITDRIIHRYFTDLDKYYQDDLLSQDESTVNYKMRIQNRFFKVLKKHRGNQILLIAHSMGSIVAFDVLTAFAKQFNIDTFVTIGSPLGLPIIMARYFAEQKRHTNGILRPATPDCIWPNWYNLSDPEDRIAIDHTLNDDYAPNRLGTSAQDISVYNDYQVNGTRNAHKAYGYLRTPEMAQIIDDFLSRSRTDSLLRRSRFLKQRKTIAFKDFMNKFDRSNK